MIQPKLCTLCGARHEPIFYLKRQLIISEGNKENIAQGNICSKCNQMLENMEMAVMVKKESENGQKL